MIISRKTFQLFRLFFKERLIVNSGKLGESGIIISQAYTEFCSLCAEPSDLQLY